MGIPPIQKFTTLLRSLILGRDTATNQPVVRVYGERIGELFHREEVIGRTEDGLPVHLRLDQEGKVILSPASITYIDDTRILDLLKNIDQKLGEMLAHLEEINSN